VTCTGLRSLGQQTDLVKLGLAGNLRAFSFTGSDGVVKRGDEFDYNGADAGYADQPDFVNACALVETDMAPRRLLDALLDIERAHGRVREIPNGPRTLDLDIVLYGDREIDEPGLRVPHPRAHERAFVLEPLVEAWPDAVIPGHGRARDCLAGLAR